MRFQIILSVFICIALVRLWIQFKKRRIGIFYFLFFLIVWLSIFFLTWNNAFLNKIGKLIGLDRGAFFLIYIGLTFLFYYVFVSTIKFYQMEKKINALIRSYALDDFCKRYKISDHKE